MNEKKEEETRNCFKDLCSDCCLKDRPQGCSADCGLQDFLNDFHTALIEDIHSSQRNFIQLVVAVISSMAIYGYGLKVFFEEPMSLQKVIFFTLTTIASIILLLIVYYGANILGYSCRASQIGLSRIEKKFCIIGNGKIIPENWDLSARLKKCDPAELPEIFLFFRLLSRLTMIILVIGYLAGIIWCIYPEDNQSLFLTIIVNIVIFVIFVIFVRETFSTRFEFGDEIKQDKKTYAQKLKECAQKLENCNEDCCK